MSTVEHYCPNVMAAASMLHSHVCDADDKDQPGHECQGVLTITRGAIKAQCPKCGNCTMKASSLPAEG